MAAIILGEMRRLNSGQVAYGEKVLHGRQVQNFGEAKVVDKIMNMRGSGSSYWAIADWLSAEGYPTKNRAKGWSAVTVCPQVSCARKP